MERAEEEESMEALIEQFMQSRIDASKAETQQAMRYFPDMVEEASTKREGERENRGSSQPKPRERERRAAAPSVSFLHNSNIASSNGSAKKRPVSRPSSRTRQRA